MHDHWKSALEHLPFLALANGSLRIDFGATGTGVTIANGKRAIVYADGSNVVRATADV